MSTENTETQEPSMDEILKTPLTEEEANEKLQQIRLQRAQLIVIRQRYMEQLAVIDSQLAAADLDKEIVYRRVSLREDKASEKPAEK